MEYVEWLKIAKAIRGVWNRDNFLSDEFSLKVWFKMLCDYSVDEVASAVQVYMAREKYQPTPADLRRIVTEARLPSAYEDYGASWEQVKKAIKHYGVYSPNEAMDSLDEVTRECVKRLGWRELCTSENETADRANFRMIYEQVQGNAKNVAVLPQEIQAKLTSAIKQIGEIR